jgi:hypothetical protein
MLVGRDTELRSILASDAPLSLLTGDSGAGKSELLAEAQSRDVAIAPPPIPLNYAPAALQTAFLTALSDAVALAAEREGAVHRLGGLVVQAAQRLAAAQAKDLAKGLGRQILGMVRAKLGGEAADALAGMVQALATSADEQLDQRIRNASAPDVIDTLKALAIDVAGMTDGRGIILAFDRLELLQPDDAYRLADLAEAAPAGVRFRGAMAVTDGKTRHLAEQLRLAGAIEFEVGGLGRGAIEDWLRREGVNERYADEVLRVTNGMCLSISDAIGLLRNGEDIHALSARPALEIHTDRAWRGLSAVARAAAARLAQLDAPLDAESSAYFLGMRNEDWAVLVAELRDARIFVDRPFPWFHELRRKYVLSRLLSLPELQQNRVAGAKALAELIKSQPRPSAQLLVQHAALLSAGVAEQLDDPKLRALSAVTDEGLAILCALIELTEAGNLVLAAPSVLDHARHFLPEFSDPVDVLRKLVAEGLIYLHEEANVAVIGATWGSSDAAMYVFGLAASRFGRLPRAQLASYVFRLVLQPLLAGFRQVRYGIGTPPLKKLNWDAAQAQMHPPGSDLAYPGKYGPNIVGWYEYAGVRMYASITFDDEQLRDQALEQLQRLHQVLDGAVVSATFFVGTPIEAVAHRRYVRAIEELLDIHIHGTTAPKRPRSDTETTLQERLRIRQALWNTAGEFDRMAYNLKQPGGIAFYASGGQFLTVEIVGGNGVLQLTSIPSGGVFTAFSRYELESLLALTSQQHLAQVSMQFGNSRDEEVPAVAEVMRAASEANSLNRFMRARVVTYDEATIQAALDEFDAQLRKDCEAISRTLGLSKSSPTVDRYLILQEPTPSPEWAAGANEDAYVVRTPGTGRSFVRVLPISELAPFSSFSLTAGGDVSLQRAMRRLFPESPDEIQDVSQTDPFDAVPLLLGHDQSSLRLRYPT